MATIEQVSRDFVAFYYQTFASNRDALASLYQPDSMLTFEGKQFQGPAAILAQLQALPFKAAQHEISTTDCQPCPGGGALVFVNGQLITEGEEHPLRFAQVFTLFPVPGAPPGSFFVLNDIFRLCF